MKFYVVDTLTLDVIVKCETRDGAEKAKEEETGLSIVVAKDYEHLRELLLEWRDFATLNR